MVDMSLKVNVDNEGSSDAVRLELKQDLDMESSPRLRKFLMRLLKKKPAWVTVDLGSVEKMDTSALATLVEFAFRLREHGGDISVCGLRENSTDSTSLEQVKGILNFCSDCRDVSGNG